MPDEDDPADEQGGIWIDGEKYTVDDLTFKERRAVRKAIREFNEDDPEFDIAFADPVMDVIPAIVWIIKRRADADYPMDKVLDLKPGDLEPPAAGEPAESGKAAPKRRPTRSASSS